MHFATQENWAQSPPALDSDSPFFQLLPWPSFLIVVLTTVALAENHCWRHACSHLAEIARSAKEAELHSA